MLEKLAKWYLIRCMRGLKSTEIVINEEFWTYRKRNKEREESIKKTLALIK